MTRRIQSFKEFYPYYLGEHRNARCRQIHGLGSCLVLIVFLTGVLSPYWQVLWLLGPAGYGPAWIGHYFFEKNRPATFKYPLWSLIADWVMCLDMLRGRVPVVGELDMSLYGYAPIKSEVDAI
jgi:hypothetical protein